MYVGRIELSPNGSSMIAGSAEQMISMIHEIFQTAINQTKESEKILATMEQVRTIAEGNGASANEMSRSLAMLDDAVRNLGEGRSG